MKNIHIKAVLMVFVIMTPLSLSTVYVFSDNTDFYECCENNPIEEQNEERESEKDAEPLEDFIHERTLHVVAQSFSEISYNVNNFKINTRYLDILTPPPKVC